jgi:poly(3-hydroxybutyrate) depolymerase
MYYQFYELNHAALQPARAFADAVKLLYSNPLNPMSHTPMGRTIAAGAEMF